MTGLPPRPDRRRISLKEAVLTAVLSTVLYLACLICAWGFISLLGNTDVIADPVGPLVGPVIAGTASVLLLLGVLAELHAGRPGLPWIGAIVTGLVVYLGAPLAGAIVVAFGRGDPVAGLLFFAARATGPYVPAAAILAFAVALLVPLVTASRGR
jgi:hypothetical protein